MPRPPKKKTRFVPRYEEVYGREGVREDRNLDGWTFVDRHA
jgi:hypothetical protein